jgi:hypothetical protein
VALKPKADQVLSKIKLRYAKAPFVASDAALYIKIPYRTLMVYIKEALQSKSLSKIKKGKTVLYKFIK